MSDRQISGGRENKVLTTVYVHVHVHVLTKLKSSRGLLTPTHIHSTFTQTLLVNDKPPAAAPPLLLIHPPFDIPPCSLSYSLPSHTRFKAFSQARTRALTSFLPDLCTWRSKPVRSPEPETSHCCGCSPASWSPSITFEEEEGEGKITHPAAQSPSFRRGGQEGYKEVKKR